MNYKSLAVLCVGLIFVLAAVTTVLAWKVFDVNIQMEISFGSPPNQAATTAISNIQQSGSDDSINQSENILGIGLPAPNFSLLDVNTRENIMLSDLEGIPVIINFWTSWCGPCKSEMPSLQSIQNKYGDRIAIIGINGDRESMEQIQYFAKDLGITFKLLQDPDNSVTKSYQIWGFPGTFFIDREGRLVKKFMGEISIEDIDKNIVAILGDID